MKILIPVFVSSAKKSKDSKTNYVEFLLVGGSINIAVTDEDFSVLKDLIGENLQVEFACKPLSVVRFNRPYTVFDVVKLIKINKGQGGK